MLQRFVSFIIATLVILASLPVVPTPAQAWLKPGAASGCVYPTDNGCAAANHNGSFQSVSLLTSAQQSGQNSLLSVHPMTFNIPGVDYPIGPDKTLTPQDPRTITWNSTTPCSYINTGPNTPPNDYVGCYTVGTYPNAALNNYDFCGTKIGKSTIPLYIDNEALAGSVFNVTNNYFCTNPSATVSQNMAFGFEGNWQINFKNNQCDGSFADSGSDGCLRDDADTSSMIFDAEYNAFTNQKVARVGGNFRNAANIFKYNFVQGLNDLITSSHGEVIIRACSSPPCSGSEYYEGNFIIWNKTTTGSTNNATFFPSTGSNVGLALSSTSMINNVIVTNNDNGGNAQVGKALFNFKAASLGTVTITGNWMDATGSNLCGVNGSAQNGDGTASTSGNTITITSLDSSFANLPIEVGYFLVNPGFTTAKISALGTGFGGTGTYTFDGAAQNQGSTSTWTFVPSYTGTPTISSNWNLADPSHTGIPTNVTFPLPTMLDVNCVGAH